MEGIAVKEMWIRIGKKCIRFFLLLFCTSIVAFVLIKASPVDPLQANVGQAALGSMSAEQMEKLEAYWGTNASPVRQYLAWITDFLKGDMGISLLYRQPVSQVIAVRMANSLPLLVCAWVLSGILGVLLGAVAGMRRQTWWDRLIRGYSLLISDTPAFWIAMLFLILFGVWLGWFPIGMSVPIGVTASEVTLADRLSHFVLPALTLSLTGTANITLHTREKMIEVMDSDYMLFARAGGEHGFGFFRRHGLRNILLPAITLQAASIGELIGGSVLVEQVFSYPGLGQAAVQAGLGSDMPLLMAVTLICAALVAAGNLIADLLYGIIDPRIRKGGART